LAMISAARSRESGRSVATTATRSVVVRAWVPDVWRLPRGTRARTARRSFLGERRRLSGAVVIFKKSSTDP
jgi:hypothetical protein